MNWKESKEAIEDAEITMRMADLMADDMAQLLVHRLRKVASWKGVNALSDLKRELQNFNIKNQTWK